MYPFRVRCSLAIIVMRSVLRTDAVVAARALYSASASLLGWKGAAPPSNIEIVAN